MLGNSDYSIMSDPAGWLSGDIIQSAQVLIKQVNPVLEVLQCPILAELVTVMWYQVNLFKYCTQEVITGFVTAQWDANLA